MTGHRRRTISGAAARRRDGFGPLRVGGSHAEQDRHGEGGEAARRDCAVNEIPACPVGETAASRGQTRANNGGLGVAAGSVITMP